MIYGAEPYNGMLGDFTHMADSFIMLAAIDPAGPFAAVCGITWTLLCPTSGVAALVSAALCPFQRTARQALRLSRVGLWVGLVAFFVAVVATVATAGFPKDPPESVADAVPLILLTGIAPVLSFFTGRVSRRKIARLETAKSPNTALEPTPTAP
jgi:cytochrome bd-type quinol oxidase subunit 2